MTGGASGIGYEVARGLAARGASVYIATRNLAAGAAAAARLGREVAGDAAARVHVLRVDLADRESIRKAVTAFNNKRCGLDILVNCAGVMFPPYLLTDDGVEASFASNHMGHYLLTCLLMPRHVHSDMRMPACASLSAHRHAAGCTTAADAS